VNPDEVSPLEPEPSGARPPADGRASEPARWLLAALLLGAAAIHLAMAPSHLGESAVEGGGFLVAAWVQLGLAVAVIVRRGRWVLGTIVGTSLALIGVWVLSRTAGLPFGAHRGHPETISLVDGACVALEGIAAVLAGLLLARPVPAVPRSTRVAVAGVLGALLLTSAAIASPSARNHAAGSHGGHTGHGAAAVASGGHHHGAAGTVASANDLGFSALANGQMGNHDHGAGTTAATGKDIDPATAGKLATQLASTAALVKSYPTLAAARAAGYWQAGPFSPGLGVHFSSDAGGPMNTDGDMDPEDIANPILIFDGLEDDAPLAGFMYMMYQETEPEGFVGPLDRWHFHTQVCMVNTPDGIRTPFGADVTGVTGAMCAAKGGSMVKFTGYMVHVWTVPGYESTLGTFSDLNPKIMCTDKTYYAIPISKIGDRDSICKNA
jgi:hypothetical protein